jgi:hypothetical protein
MAPKQSSRYPPIDLDQPPLDAGAESYGRRVSTHSPLLGESRHSDGSPPLTPTMDASSSSMHDPPAMMMQQQQHDRSPDRQQRYSSSSGAAAANTTSRRPGTGAGAGQSAAAQAATSPPQSQSAFFSGPHRPDVPDDPAAAGSSRSSQRRRVPRHTRRQSESLDAALNAVELAAPSGKQQPMQPSQNGHGHGHGSPNGNGMPAAYHEAAAREVHIPPAQNLQQLQQQHRQQLRNSLGNPNGNGALSPGADDIDRVGSPSVATSVLKPLESKMREYHELMDDAQRQLAQLDNELIALQERRRQAEERFVDAKNKHDIYERQHSDVEKALRGDFQSSHSQQPHQSGHFQPSLQQQQQHNQQQYQSQTQLGGSRPSLSRARQSSIDSYDDRPMSRQSKGKGRFRLSLFK